MAGVLSDVTLVNLLFSFPHCGECADVLRLLVIDVTLVEVMEFTFCSVSEHGLLKLYKQTRKHIPISETRLYYGRAVGTIYTYVSISWAIQSPK